MIAADLMTRRLITVTPEASARHAISLMLKHRLGALPVVDIHGRLAGMLSEGDLLRHAGSGDSQRGALVDQLMSTPVISVAPEATIEHVLELMKEHAIKRVPVLREGRLEGMVSRANLLQALLRTLPADVVRHSDHPPEEAPQLAGDRVALVEMAALELDADIGALGMALVETIKLRRSQRAFDAMQVPLYRLSRLLWAAYGINRAAEHGRTAPSVSNAQEIDIYVAMASGWYRYDASAPALIRCGQQDIRSATGKQEFAGVAPLDLLYVANLERLPAEERSDAVLHAALDAGHISQNVYLFCAAEGMATVARAWFDHDALARAMDLGATQRVMLAQTVGYPA